MRPQDVVVLFKIISYGTQNWYSKNLANDLFLSTAEISNSLQRCAASGLLDNEKKRVNIQSLQEFLQYGLPYVFPQQPASIARGMVTAHSHPDISKQFVSEQLYVWPDPEGEDKGLAIEPLYPGTVKAAKKDSWLYLMLALTDILRLGKTRERQFAINLLKDKLINEPSY